MLIIFYNYCSCNQWLKNCKLYDLCGQSEDYIYKNYRVCSKHFVASSYCNPEKTRLLPTATPTEFGELI